MTKSDLQKQLQDMGIKPTDCVMLHSSMKAIGEVEGGADTVVDAFMEYLSDGMFMTPTHTWKQMSAEYHTFDPAKEPSCVGIISEIFRNRENVYRSLHPTHSIAAYGKNAKKYVLGDELFHTPCHPKGCFGRLKDIHAKIVLAGVTHAKNTYIHSIEESYQVEERFTKEPTIFYTVLENGTKIEIPMYRHYNAKMAHISESFDKLMDYYFAEKAAIRGKLGNADCIVCDAQKLYEATGKILKKQPDYFIAYDRR